MYNTWFHVQLDQKILDGLYWACTHFKIKMPTPKLFQIRAWHCGQNFKFCSKYFFHVNPYIFWSYFLKFSPKYIHTSVFIYIYIFLARNLLVFAYLITLHFLWMKTVLIFFGHNFETPAIVLGWLAFKSLESLEKIVEASDGWWLGGICVKSGWCIFHC